MAIPFELTECVRFWARHYPNSPAITSDGVVWSYSDLVGQVERVAAGLGSIEPGKRIAVLADDKRDTTLGVLSALMTGCSAVVLNPHLPIDSLRACIDDAQPVGFMVSGGDAATFEAMMTPATPGAVSLADMPVVMFPAADRIVPGGARAYADPADDDEWAILYSSGSTGTPKGIERDHESMQTELIGWCLELALTRETRFYIGRPVYYTGGLVLTMAMLLRGGSVVFGRPDAVSGDALVADLTAATHDSPLDWVFVVPDQLRALVSTSSIVRIKGKIRNVLVMGAPVSGREKRALADRLESVVIESWGNSESLGTITDAGMLADAPDSAGRPFLGDSMCIVDEMGSRCQPGVVGRISGDEAAGFTRYTKRPEQTADVKRGGLIVSEDLGWMDRAGRFFIGGRIQERVRVGDRTLFLPAVEESLRKAGISGAFCLVSRPANGGQLGLLTESAAPLMAEVERVIRQAGLANEIVSIVSTPVLPRTASGKIDRGAASAIVWPTPL